MNKYFASHIYEEDQNGVPYEHFAAQSAEERWADPLRWTTAASENGAKKNIRAKIKAVLGYDWKSIQSVNMVFGPVKKETYLGIYHAPASEKKVEESVENTVNTLVETFEYEDFYNFKEEKVMNKKEMIKNSNAVLIQIIDKRTNEEKHLFAEVFRVLHNSNCYVGKSIDKPDCVVVSHDEEGVIVAVKSAIEFAREVYTEIGQLVDETNAKAIRSRLEELFGIHKEATGKEEVNPYEELAASSASRWTLMAEVILQYQKPGEDKPRKFTVKRKVTVVKLEDKFYNGYVYHSNGQYLGHWYWNTKYNRPSFNPKQDIGNYNRINYEYAIRKALRTLGLHSEYMPEAADRYAKKAV